MSNSLRDLPPVRGADILASSVTSALRLWGGINASPAAKKPKLTLQLYEFEGCPFCRLVREGLTELDLDALIYPCPHGGKRYRPKVAEMGGKTQFPYLVDPNTGKSMYESLDILAYLYRTYGKRPLPLKWRLGPLQQLGSALSAVPRMGRGSRARRSRAPVEPLELYSFEGSPFARPVRELLCELEIPYLLRSAGRTSLRDWVPPPLRDKLDIRAGVELENRKVLLERAGRVAIPYLVDPNTGTEMFESTAICQYLRETYQA